LDLKTKSEKGILMDKKYIWMTVIGILMTYIVI
jgi:hypothetical protein